MMKTESSNTQTSRKLTITLIVTALCSQALPGGLFMLVTFGAS
jgi:hypothetical protein